MALGFFGPPSSTTWNGAAPGRNPFRDVHVAMQHPPPGSGDHHGVTWWNHHLFSGALCLEATLFPDVKASCWLDCTLSPNATYDESLAGSAVVLYQASSTIHHLVRLGPSCDPVCSDWTQCAPPTVWSQASLATQPETLTVFTALASWRCPSGPHKTFWTPYCQPVGCHPRRTHEHLPL